MFVVIEIEDHGDPGATLAEVILTEQSRVSIVTDELFDPDEDGDPLVLHTEHIEMGVARIVGSLSESLESGDSPLYFITPLEG